MKNSAQLFGLLLILMASVAVAAPTLPPAAPVHPVIDDYFGTQVVDNYRWMEKPGSPELAVWMKEQNDYTRSILDSLPGREALLQHIHQLDNRDIDRFNFVRRGQRYFYEVASPGAQLPVLYYRDGLKGDEHVLLDPSTLSKKPDTHYAIDYFMPSWDGRYVAYGISPGGSEQSVLHVLKVDNDKIQGEAIDRTSQSTIAWLPDSHAFFYMRFNKRTPGMPPSQMMFNARTYLHTLGIRDNGDKDPVVFGYGVSKQVNVPQGQGTYLVLSPDSPYAIAVADHNLDYSPKTLFVSPLTKVRGSHTPWRKIAGVEDGVTQFEPHGDMLYFLSHKAASNSRLLRTSLSHPDVNHAQVIVPESQAVITDFGTAKDGLYVRERDGVISKLLHVSWDGKHVDEVPLPFEGNVFPPTTDPTDTGALFSIQGWVEPAKMISYDPATNTSIDTGLLPVSKVNTSQLESKEVFATSYDGTRIPLSIIYKKGLKLDSTNPTIMQGYGSYGFSIEPFFPPQMVAWVERGGVYTVPHVRGGGEYGENWHQAGKNLNKINSILDFIACAQYLIDQHYTSPKYLVAEGKSAGAILSMGALTWRPNLFTAVIDNVGLTDMLRTENTPNGPPNTVEFGSVKTETGFHGLYSVSAYAHVRDGTPYPAALFNTGVNDPRVAPWEVAKMAARVQAATSSGKPVLLRVEYDAGHGLGSTRSELEDELADEFAFALWQTGNPEFQPTTSK